MLNSKGRGWTPLAKLGAIMVLVFGGGFLVWKFGFNSQAGSSSVSFGSTSLHGLVGGEKVGFLENENVKSILRKKYGIEIDYKKAGSIEMVKDKIPDGADFLWPSNQTALELFTSKNGSPLKSEIIFSSPVVFYSWDNVAGALGKTGIVSTNSGSHYADLPRLLWLIHKRTTWTSIGLPELFGPIVVTSTDPSRSNSGNMFAGLVCNANGVVDERSLGRFLPDIKDVFSGMGYMEHSSSDLFEQYLRMGDGAKPVIVGYENQIVEFAVKNPERWTNLKTKLRIIYPVPTVWSSHTLIALTPKAKKLIEALQDEEIQKIAWESHGFRSGLAGLRNEPTIQGIPSRITQVVPMPSARVMDQIIESISSR